MKMKIVWILILLLIVLIFFSTTSYYESSSSALTFSSSDWRSQVMNRRYILPDAPKEWIANYIDFGPNYLDAYTSLSDDQFSNMMNYISKNDFYRSTFYDLTYEIIQKDGKQGLLNFSIYGLSDSDADQYVLKYYIPSIRKNVLNNTNDRRNKLLSDLTDEQLLYFLKYVSGARNTENSSNEMRKITNNLILHGNLKGFIDDKILYISSKNNINDTYLINNMKLYTPYCKNSWWQFWRHRC